MCAGTPGVDNFTEKGGARKTGGIVPGHAYSVIACKEYNNIRLLKVRNPWGQFEWEGAWSDKSNKWTQEMIDAFQPSFDVNDGTFWISFKDFLSYFCSITVCKVENWRELRLKGIFLRVFEAEDQDEDFVLSKFYYSFHLEEETVIEIGLHQEDERIMGADRRRYVDMQILLLKRHSNGTLTIEFDSGSMCDRDCEAHVNLAPGHYIVIPRTSGATLSHPNNNAKAPVQMKVDYHGNERLHPELRTTIDDIFRRVDLQLNGSLSAEEINQLGNIVGNEKMMSITSEDLESEEFKNISCDANGVTRYGMRQMIRRLDADTIMDFLQKLGYNDALYSTKSKPFIITFHTNSKLRVRIGDALKTDLNERAWDLMMNSYYKTEGATGAIQNSDIVVFRKYHSDSYSVTYGAINKSDSQVEVKFNMSKSRGMIHTPSKGSIRTVIPPRGLVYLSSSILDPGNSSFAYSYSFASKRT